MLIVMINYKPILLALFLGATFNVMAQDIKFPDIGILYISGLDCSEERVTDEVPKESIQYFLTSGVFFRLTVTDTDIQEIKIPYPEMSWMETINNLPNEPVGCSVGIAIHDASLDTAKYAMKRNQINAGKIYNDNDFYYWGN